MQRVKSIILTLTIITSSLMMFGQEDYKWSVLNEGLNASNSELFERSLFWISVQNMESKEIVFADFDNQHEITMRFAILEAGRYLRTRQDYTYRFLMTLTFLPNSVQFEIDSVRCIKAIRITGGDIEIVNNIDPTTEVPVKNSDRNNLSRKQFNFLMEKLKSDLQGLVDGYTAFISIGQKEAGAK